MTVTQTPTPRLWAEFADVEPDDTLLVVVEAADWPSVGDDVLLFDDEGNRCHAEVTARLTPDVIQARIKWETWASESPVENVFGCTGVSVRWLHFGALESTSTWWISRPLDPVQPEVHIDYELNMGTALAPRLSATVLVDVA